MDFEQTKMELRNIESIIDAKNNPAVKSTIIGSLKLIPFFGDLLDNTIEAMLLSFQKEKQEKFLNILLEDTTITREMVNDVEFLMEFAKTLEALNRVMVNEKIIYFASLFKYSYCAPNKITADEYEEYLAILQELSYREIFILYKLFEYEEHASARTATFSTSWSVISKYWDNFISEIRQTLKIPEPVIYSLLQKLTHTGLYSSNFTDIVTGSQPPGYTTEYYARFYAKLTGKIPLYRIPFRCNGY